MRDPPSAPQLLLCALLGILLLGPDLARAERSARTLDEIPIKLPLTHPPLPAASPFATTQADTIWIGYVPGSRSPSNPLGVGVGGVWDFDSGIAGTDSTQFWSFFLPDWRHESTTALPQPEDRPIWYFDHGNEANIGDTNLWLDRESRAMHAQNKGPVHTAGYLRTGITGYWHVDDMSGVSSPVSGARSAWCGLRGPNDFTVLDAVTGNPLNGDLARYWTFGGALINGSWPGYGNQIEQILYHDVILATGDGTDVLSFKFRTDMSDLQATENNGSAWFNPDPTSMVNFVLDPVDSLMVWVGRAQEVAYDVNKRWLSEVIDFDSANQPQKLFAQHGKAPLVGNDSTVTVNLPAWGAGTTVRLAFQVKTNREYSDETYGLHGFDSAEGAALVDDIKLNAALIGDFEGSDAIRPRYYLPGGGVQTENSPFVYWITTGKPPAGYGHVHSAYDLPYDDPCGALGSQDRLCDLDNNVITLSNHDDPDHAFFRESWVGAESPTIPLYDGSPIQTALDGQGYDLFRLEYQLWTGTMGLDESVFWNVGARYHGPTFLQQADNLDPGWSDNIVASFISFNPDPACVVFSSDTDLDGIIPPPSQLDSMKVMFWTQTRCARFGATVLCGKPEGGYFDNIRVAFTGGDGPAITAQFWDLLGDTFPFNEDVAPGTAAFDTTTALIKDGLNNASSAGGEGVINGDTLVVQAAYVSSTGNSTRIDYLFRIKPGPGNYSDPGNTASPLTEKDPARPFWAAYSANPGPFSKGVHPPGGWDPTTWNSARMDSAEYNISPLVSRQAGVPYDGYWHGTLHEEDPNYLTLGIVRNICFMIDPTGGWTNENICCSATECAGAPFLETWPPSAYPAGTPTETIERTKILPDGYFCPGTHIEYFMRRSDADNPFANLSLTPDTTRCDQQSALGPHYDGQRFLEVDVFPDLWKDQRFGGSGLACMLFVDAADRRGQEHAIIGALDSLGYGKNNGAGRGWWEDDPSTSNPDPNDPGNWVFHNLGQKGLAFDWFDIQASESGEADRPGVRLAPAPPELQSRQCKQGPTPEMLKAYYNTILWMAQDLEYMVMSDGVYGRELPNDVGLVQDFLVTSSSGTERAFWLAGDGAAFDLANSNGDAPALLSQYFATLFEAENYRVSSGNQGAGSAVINLLGEFHAPRAYGFFNSCELAPDVISVNGAVTGAQLAQRYEDATDGDVSINPGTYGAAVYRPADNASRYYTTLISAYQQPSLRGGGFENMTTDFGRIAFVDDVLSAFNLCSAIGPVIGVGDLPGAGGMSLNFVRGAFPNPSVSGAATVQFDLARPAEVTIRFYNVAGRLVHEAKRDGVAGPNTYRWDGRSSTGIRVAPGVYFYRLSAPGIEFRGNNRRMVLLGTAGG